MAVVVYPDIPASLGVRGKLGFGRGYGASEYGKLRYGFSEGVFGISFYGDSRYGSAVYGSRSAQSGIYQRKLYALGSTLAPRQLAGRYAISRMKFYRPTESPARAANPMRAVYGAGVGAWRGLTTIQKARYSKAARTRNMSGYNLFMSQWFHSRRS